MGCCGILLSKFRFNFNAIPTLISRLHGDLCHLRFGDLCLNDAQRKIRTLRHGDYGLRTRRKLGLGRDKCALNSHRRKLARCVVGEFLVPRSRWVPSQKILYETEKVFVRMWTEGLMLSITYTKNHIWSNFKRFWTPKSEQFTAKSCLQILTANLFLILFTWETKLTS